MGYRDIYDGWKADPEAFWLQAAHAIDWVKPPSKALNDARAPLYEWFTDSMVNTCWNAVDRHVEAGRGDQAAIIHDSPVTRSKHSITYAELQTRVATLAGALRAKGVREIRGDYVKCAPDRIFGAIAQCEQRLEAPCLCAFLCILTRQNRPQGSGVLRPEFSQLRALRGAAEAQAFGNRQGRIGRDLARKCQRRRDALSRLRAPRDQA